MLSQRENIATVLAFCVLLLGVMVLFLGLYYGLAGPSGQLVGPLVAGLGFFVVLVTALGVAGHLRKREQQEAKSAFLQTKARVANASCSLSQRDVCLRRVQQLPEGSEKGKQTDSCSKLSAQTECTDQVLEACKTMVDTAEPGIRMQFTDMIKNKNVKVEDILNLCNIYAHSNV
jgi:hypothetical protein